MGAIMSSVAGYGVNKGMDAMFGGGAQNMAQQPVDATMQQRQAVQQLLKALMMQMQQQQGAPQPAVQMESMNQFPSMMQGKV